VNNKIIILNYSSNSIHRPTNEANMNGELSNAKKLSPYEDKLNYHSMPDF
jgi:hypothetical protein